MFKQLNKSMHPTRQSRDFAVALQSVYGLCFRAPPGKVEHDAHGSQFNKLVYVGASTPSQVEDRIHTQRRSNATLAKLCAQGWDMAVLFVDNNVPIGSEDAATTTMRLHYLREPSTRVIGGVTAALAAPAYSFTREVFERVSDNSALGACLRCDYRSTSIKVAHWKSCSCARDGRIAPEETARREAATLPRLRNQAETCRRYCADLEAKLQRLTEQAHVWKNESADYQQKCASLQATLEELTPVRDSAQPGDVEAPENSSGSQDRWKGHVVGVSLAAQTGFGRGHERRAFQVKLPFAPHKMYFSFTTWTKSDSAPCASEDCWKKIPGKRLQSCGRDICVFSAACACKAELNLAHPDGRKRKSADQGALKIWEKRWRSAPRVRLRSKTARSMCPQYS